MKIKLISSLALSAALACVCGCVGTEDGHSTAGIPFTKDTITSRYQRPVGAIATATRTVLQHNGKMLVDNSVNNTFEAKVNQRTVWVKVSDVDGKLSEVDVQVRGPAAGDVDLAAELSKQIALQLEAQNQNQ
ncbi:MAG TPA: DUF3568 family protein [Verrucomicrobiae bacterium]|jgi:hypothetical protein|nr:DUF3568 family protein [Verrucomicrobiae bacterium]